MAIEMDIEYVQPGDILARTEEKIHYHGSGSSTTTDLIQGATLTTELIKSLKKLGINTIWIKEEADEKPIIDKYSAEEKRKSIKKFKTIFDSLKSKQGFDVRGIETSVHELVNKFMLDIKSYMSIPSFPSIITEIDSHDSYTLEHSLNVVYHSLILSTLIPNILREFRLSEKGMKYLREGDVYFYIAMNALFHDVGKIKVPTTILNKIGKLDNEEFSIVKNHPKYGIEVIKDLNRINLERGLKQIPSTYLVGCIYHHANWDGTGYPVVKDKDGFNTCTQKAIPLIGRIIAVADKFDAITSSRPYRGKTHNALAIKWMKSDLGKALDPELGKKFIDIINPFNKGTTVVIDNGDLGQVVSDGSSDKYNPLIKPIMRKMSDGEIMKLRDYPAVKILDSNYDIILNGVLYKKDIYDFIKE
jgi:HD-GYP domain-containing protein (c-di-GMP phosphodiesterase class II)